MNKKILTVLVLVLVLVFAFSSTAFASLTFTTNSITGTTASTIDLGSSNALSLQTTSNGNIVTGTGNFGIANTSPGELLTLGLAGTTKGVLSLSGNTSGKIIIQPNAVAGTYTLTLPNTAGTLNQVLTTDGTGVLSWATVSGGSGTVTTTGSPVTGQVPLLSGATSITGDTGLLWSGTGTSFLLTVGKAVMGGDNGNLNTFFGFNTMLNNRFGNGNTAFGGRSLLAITTGYSNVAVGDSTLVGVTTGTSNTAIGSATLPTVTTGTDNIAIGANSNVDSATAVNRIVIGDNLSGTKDNAAFIGNSSVTQMTLGAGSIWAKGTGSPESVVTAPVGSFYSRTDGGAGTSFYVKETGAGNTGWVAK